MRWEWSGRRGAGAAAVTTETAPTLPESSSFDSGVRAPGSYFLSGAPSQSSPSLWFGSSARFVADLRRDLGLSAVLVIDRDALTRLSTALEAVRPGWMQPADWSEAIRANLGSQAVGSALGLEALRAAVWYTYLRTSYPEGPGALTFTAALGVPRVGETLASVDVATEWSVLPSFNANSIPGRNPFTGEAPQSGIYNPWGPGGSASVRDTRGGWSGKTDGADGEGSSDSALMWGLGFLGAALIFGGDK